jgi:hypothetical protein
MIRPGWQTLQQKKRNNQHVRCNNLARHAFGSHAALLPKGS